VLASVLAEHWAEAEVGADTGEVVVVVVVLPEEEEEASHPGGHGPFESSGGHAFPVLSFPAAHSPAVPVVVSVVALLLGQHSSSAAIRPT
jgi:hypothetical protein